VACYYFIFNHPQMEKETASEETLFENITGYVNARVELVRLQMIEKAAAMMSNALSLVIIIPFFLIAFLFLSVALAHYFAELWGHEYAGYLTVTGIYLLVGFLLVWNRRNWLIKPLQNTLIKQLFSKHKHD
jgi:uncharacterized membrane protein